MESDLAIALDMSGSIRLENFRREIEFVRRVVYGLNMPQHRVSLTTFGNEATTRYPSILFHTISASSKTYCQHQYMVQIYGSSHIYIKFDIITCTRYQHRIY